MTLLYRLLLIYLLAAAAIPALAQVYHPQPVYTTREVCGLTLYTQDGEKFTAYCNGNKVNAQPGTKVKVRELDTDVVRVKIVFAKSALGTIERTLYLRLGDEERHVIKRRTERDRVETAGAGLEEKLLGALGQDAAENDGSPYTIVFNNAVSYVPQVETQLEVDETTRISTDGRTVRRRTSARVRTTAR